VKSLVTRSQLGSLVAALLCLIYVAECVCFIQTQSLTYDEPVHIAEGLEAWRNRRFEKWNDHPPLARLWCTLPLLRNRNQIAVEPVEAGWQVTQLEPNPESMARPARLMNVVLGLTLVMLLWRTARRMFSIGSANLVMTLFVFSPSAIAHFSLVTTDGAATLFLFAVAVYLVDWKYQPTYLRTVYFGGLLGLLLLSKFSTPVMFAVALLWMLISTRHGVTVNPLLWNWRKAATAVLVAILMVWAGYFFHVSRLTIHNHQLTATFPNRPPVVFNNVHTRINLNLIVPAGEYLEGFRKVVRRNRQGQPSFLLGHVSQEGGFKAYYPVAILLKWPLIVLLLFFVGSFLLGSGRVRTPQGLWLMMSFPAIYFLMAVFARFDIGERHILPVYPFVLLLAGATWEFALQRRLLLFLLTLLAALMVADVGRYAPDYLSYFNIYIRPQESDRLLTDSNLDWGQGLLALREYTRTHPQEQISLAYFGSVDPKFYGIHVHRLVEGEHATGTVIVSATTLSGQYLRSSDSFQWVRQYSPPSLLNHSLYVFHIPQK